jgi:hypothetical protein
MNMMIALEAVGGWLLRPSPPQPISVPAPVPCTAEVSDKIREVHRLRNTNANTTQQISLFNPASLNLARQSDHNLLQGIYGICIYLPQSAFHRSQFSTLLGTLILSIADNLSLSLGLEFQNRSFA